MPSSIQQQYREENVPAAALRATLGPCQFTAGDPQSGETPFATLARSAKPVHHWFWGAIYHDFGGMTRDDSIAIDYCHREDEVIGRGDQFRVDAEGLHIAGALIHGHEGDRVDQVTRNASKGVPYQASIDFRGPMAAEEVQQGMQAQVNGQTVEGPALIIRQWTLRGLAICPHGMDPNTSAQLTQDGREHVVRIFSASEGPTMPKAKLSDAVKQKQTASETQTDNGQQAGNSNGSTAAESGGNDSGDESGDSDDSSDAESGDDAGESSGGDNAPEQQQTAGNDDAGSRTFTAEQLDQFTQAFGAENGLKWLREGKTFAEATAAHNGELQKQLAAERKEREKLEQRLTAAGVGEETPATMSEDPGDAPADDKPAVDPRFNATLGPGLGTFAAAMKLPTGSDARK